MATMRAVDVKGGTGPPSALFINPDIPKPKPTAEQCLIHIKAFGLNRADTLQRVGKYPIPPGVTHIMGLEFSGVIVEVGHGNEAEERHNWKEGDEVFGLAYGGGYAEYIAVHKKMLIRKPKELSWEICGGVCEVWFTALQALHLVGEYNPQTTRSILWHAGGSSVSIAGIQLSLAANKHHSSASTSSSATTSGSKDLPPPKVFVTARQDSKVKMCIDTLGCTGGVNTTTAANGDWSAALKAQNGGEGVDLLVDFVGASYFAQNLDVLALDGRAVQLGNMGGVVLPGETDMSPILRKRLRYQGSTLRSRTPEYQGKLRDLFEELVLPGLLDGSFDSRIDTALDWKEIGKAHEMLEENKTMGKLVCLVDW